ncbi:amidohydrolase [Clostridium cylindrosporum]|uniref:Putative amidohydrolase n=1 Tax=Clostridium cylindrosporum DSM 605 TaxID=1121307 RepID=A0A0J8G6Z9_CLOCY|nr:amidohydrolase [Clostridium cylindrosporum]KMT23361.1 putative amidohydrolase [Clostridium cylindrosporum DSM 605]
MSKDNTLIIRGGKVITMAGSVYEAADVFIQDGKIMDIASNIDLKCNEIDASGKVVLPGFIEAHSHIGIEEPNNDNPGNLNETSSPITPYINGIDGVNFYDESFKRALEAGITTVATGPGSGNVIGGTFGIIKTFGEDPFDMIFRLKSSMKAALGENPKRIHSSKGRAPVTKMGISHMLRDTLNKSMAYRNLKVVKLSRREYFEENRMYEEMLPVIEGSMPLSIHVHRADDIVTALRIADEYNIKIQLLHATDGIKLKDEIKKRNISAIVGPIMSFSKKVETREKSPFIAREFIDKGIITAISTDHPVTPIEYLPISAALCVREGMDYMKALEAITISPAKILGIDRQVGSIEVGKDADITIINGDPLDVMSKVHYVIGKGKIVYEYNYSR